MEKRTALLVIDVQVGPLWGAYKKEETLTIIQQMITKATEREIPIIYIQHEELPGELMSRGSRFWQFADGISPRSQDAIIPKLATDSFYQTALQEELAKREITHLIVVGAQTQYCVDTTCRSAIFHGYEVTLVEDGHTTVDGDLPAEAIIRHHNYNLCTVGTPDRRITILPSSKVVF